MYEPPSSSTVRGSQLSVVLSRSGSMLSPPSFGQRRGCRELIFEKKRKLQPINMGLRPATTDKSRRCCSCFLVMFSKVTTYNSDCMGRKEVEMPTDRIRFGNGFYHFDFLRYSYTGIQIQIGKSKTISKSHIQIGIPIPFFYSKTQSDRPENIFRPEFKSIQENPGLNLKPGISELSLHSDEAM